MIAGWISCESGEASQVNLIFIPRSSQINKSRLRF